MRCSPVKQWQCQYGLGGQVWSHCWEFKCSLCACLCLLWCFSFLPQSAVPRDMHIRQMGLSCERECERLSFLSVFPSEELATRPRCSPTLPQESWDRIPLDPECTMEKKITIAFNCWIHCNEGNKRLVFLQEHSWHIYYQRQVQSSTDAVKPGGIIFQVPPPLTFPVSEGGWR